MGFQGNIKGLLREPEAIASAATQKLKSDVYNWLISGSETITALSESYQIGAQVRFIGAAGAAVVFTDSATLNVGSGNLTLGADDVLEIQKITGTKWIRVNSVDN